MSTEKTHDSVEISIFDFVNEVERLIKTKHTGSDLYNQAVSNLTGVALDAVPPELRSVLKTASFGVRFGASPESIRAAVAKISGKVE